MVTATKSRESKRQKTDLSAAPPFDLCSSASPSYSEAMASVARLLQSRKRILVLAGAGISVSCGIKDFRSPNGLYATLDTEELGLSCPEDLFDLDFFQHDPQPFYKFAKALYYPLGSEKRVEPSDSHRFLAMLEQQGRLLRVYTQNIDGLEEVAGVSPKHIVYAHGSLRWATCCRCKQKVTANELEDVIVKGEVARCRAPNRSSCKIQQPSQHRVKTRGLSDQVIMTRKRSSSFSDGGIYCNGVLKPGVTFFGETLQDKVRRSLEVDREKADALIVIGTSLSVAPMSHVIQYLPPSIPRILINRTMVTPPQYSLDADEDDNESHQDDDEEEDFRENYTFDSYLLGFCDDVTRAIVKELNHEKPTTKVEGKLLATLDKDDKIFYYSDWTSTTIPHQRILLFPGAMLAPDDDNLTYTEVAHCDGCTLEIKGSIRKCVQCFDYDLCRSCYPKLSKVHHNGKHKFRLENVGR